MKKLPSLHILNGDASIPAFEAAKLPGQVLVWREVLSEGPVGPHASEKEFWQKRQAFITAAFAESAEGYRHKVLDELPKLQEAPTFFEVVLWFDADLMCQVNLLYLLQRLSRQHIPRICLCTPAPGKNIGLLDAEEVQALFQERLLVTEALLAQARELWELYAGSNPLQLQDYLKQQQLLPRMAEALTLHLTRFPVCETGISLPHQYLLQAVQQGTTTLQALLQHFSEHYPGYGFGDYQLKSLLQELQPELVTQHEPYQLTQAGQQVIAGQKKYTRWLQQHAGFGGVSHASAMPYCYKQEEAVLTQNNF
ncbi:DUF1835 domain-containing protein [Pontibacter sp. SGAir0037]|uniref:DUF1835 domain-containing protein n=1 Tax=Pontibacter sp. SGAir0037 TaxID=2571030 RepID=UPI0010CD1BCE|nr:DUF1835 domain-containing protein [Pontibacter sp. SGAir0037]QCR21492.1 hypothetical protein C1N53_03440 [Pontibacter sp. SGAir0037]